MQGALLTCIHPGIVSLSPLPSTSSALPDPPTASPPETTPTRLHLPSDLTKYKYLQLHRNGNGCAVQLQSPIFKELQRLKDVLQRFLVEARPLEGGFCGSTYSLSLVREIRQEEKRGCSGLAKPPQSPTLESSRPGMESFSVEARPLEDIVTVCQLFISPPSLPDQHQHHDDQRPSFQVSFVVKAVSALTAAFRLVQLDSCGQSVEESCLREVSVN